MLLFQKRFHAGLLDGSITVTFRRWQKPHVRPGGRYRCHPIGVLEVESVEAMEVREIGDADVRASGFETKKEFADYLALARPEEELLATSAVWRVRFHHGGDGDRVEIALEDKLTPADVVLIKGKLTKMDAGAAWTKKTFALIEKNPRIAASKLAAMLGRETLPFKVDVRRLKKLGLTQSFEVGYEISPRGRAYLAATKKK